MPNLLLESARGVIEKELRIPCKIYDGPISAQDLGSLTTTLPAIGLSCAGVENMSFKSRDLYALNLDITAYVIVSNMKGNVAFDIVASLMGLLPGQNWGQPGIVGISTDAISAVNLFDGQIDSKGVTLWGISWHQSVKFER